MNRKQRRAKGIKNTDPTLVFKQSDARGFLKNLVREDPKIQQAIQEEAHRQSMLELQQREVDIDTLILYSLHKSEKYGRKRLLRFAKTFIELREHYSDFYEDCDMFAMRKHLREQTGIDVEHLDEELKKYAEEDPD